MVGQRMPGTYEATGAKPVPMSDPPDDADDDGDEGDDD